MKLRAVGVVAVAICIFNLIASPAARGQVIFETASKGPPVTSIFFQPVLSNQVMGTRFQITQPTTITHIGGHLLSDGVPGRLTFASLVALSGPGDFPDSVDRTTPDFLATTTLFPTNPSSDVEGAIAPLEISPGWYGLLFGEWQGGNATFIVRGNNVIGSPTFFGGSVSGGPVYDEWPEANESVRMYVKGVPEPTALATLVLASLALRRAPSRVAV